MYRDEDRGTGPGRVFGKVPSTNPGKVPGRVEIEHIRKFAF